MILAPQLSQKPPQMPPKPPKVGPIAPIPAPGTGGWRRVTIAPAALAARGDARLNGLKNAIANWAAFVNLPAGSGQAYGRDVVWSSAHFRIETLGPLSAVRRIGITKTTWRAENGRLAVLGAGAWEPRGRPAAYATLPAPILPAFLTGFDGILKRGIAGGKPFAALVKAATAKGYRVLAERRVASGEPELRLFLAGGAARYAVVFKERQMLPTDVGTELLPPAKGRAGGKPTRILWLGAWAVKRTPLTAADAAGYNPPPMDPRER